VRAPVLAAAAALVLLSGCGSDDPKEVVILNTERVERAIEDSIQSKRHLEAHVSCPSGVHQQKSLQFECTAELERGGTTTFDVTQTDDKGHVTYVGR
jgi:hypothetical protein